MTFWKAINKILHFNYRGCSFLVKLNGKSCPSGISFEFLTNILHRQFVRNMKAKIYFRPTTKSNV